VSRLPPYLFNQRLLWQRSNRFKPAQPHYLDHMMAETLKERLGGIKRSFKKVLLLSNPQCYAQVWPEADFMVSVDQVTLDQQFLPFQHGIFDLIVSCGSWQWVNDLPGTLAQVRNCLQPDGLLLAAFPGGDSLWQLRESLYLAEDILLKGVSPRVAPMIAPHDAAALLQRAGFALPVVDQDRLTLYYDTLPQLLNDLRFYGQTNVLSNQTKGLSPANLFKLTEEIYREKFATSEGKLPVTITLIYLTGWRPAATQPKALTPGSAQMSLIETLASL
jgi:SAM-dependent methyltransferase